jgi:ribosomal RNA-processing protein 36
VDPRFEGLSGAFNQERFRKQYGFIYDEQLPEDRKALREALKVRHPPPTSESFPLQRM